MLHRLIYHSFATSEISAPFVESILEECKNHNAKTDVTGCLLVSGNQFAQLIEGKELELEKIYNNVKQDKRNTEVTLIEFKITDRRLFQMSPMAYEVVGKDDFEKIGAGSQKDLGFVKEQPEMASKLFDYVKKLWEAEPARQGLWHNARIGPLA